MADGLKPDLQPTSKASARRPNGRFSSQLRFTPEQEAIIRKIWGGPPKTRGQLKALRDEWLPRLGPFDARQAYHHALRRGWVTPTFDYRPWTAAEDMLLERYGHCCVSHLQLCFKRHGFKRSQAALTKRREDLLGGALQARLDNGHYSGQQAAALVGMSGRMISHCIRLGYLKATDSGRRNSTGVVWDITARDLRAFVLEHTRYIDLSQVDKYAFVDLLCPKHGRKGDGGEA